MTIQILMATHNGAAYLADQLDSIAAQSRDDWRLIASDDESDDGTVDILRAFAARFAPGKVEVITGPGQGAAANFLSLLAHVGADQFTAFADQDDLWLPSKLEKAVGGLVPIPAGVPALYCSRVTIAGPDLRARGQSPLPTRGPSFTNALVQNIAHGHTVVLNRAGAALMREASARVGQVVLHDWWAYLVVSGAAGRVIYDPESAVLYRQHGQNAVGARTGLAAIGDRARGLGQGKQAGWMARNLANLAMLGDLLTPENRSIVRRLIAARGAGRISFARAIWAARIARQGRFGRILPVLAALLGRI